MADLSEIRVFETAAELMDGAADEVQRALSSTVSRQGRCTWVLAGGSTPRGLYERLVSLPLPWERIHFFWGDERHVPPEDPDSNFRMASEALLDKVLPPAGNVHRVPAEEPDAARAAARYDEEIRAFFDLRAEEWPVFDLVLLGLGKDAHTASLFPGGSAVHETSRLVVAPWVEAQRTFRITMTPPVFHQARRLIFLVSGEDKARALRDVIEGPRDVNRFPAQAVSRNGLWMVDRPAARLLARR